MRKTGIWLTVSLFVLLAGCLPQQDSEEEILQNDPEAEQETSIVKPVARHNGSFLFGFRIVLQNFFL